MTDRPGRVRSLPQLAWLAERSPALDVALTMAVEQMPLASEVRARLAALGRSSPMSVREFLHRRDLHRKLQGVGILEPVLAAFQTWVERAPAPPGGGRDLQQLVAAAGVPDLLEWTAGTLEPSLPFDLAPRTLRALTQERGLRPQRAQLLREALAGFVRRVEKARAAPPPELRPTGDQRLDSFRGGLQALRGPLLSGWPRGLVPARMQVREEGNSLWIGLETGGDDELDHPELNSRYFWRYRAPSSLRQLCIPNLSDWERKLELRCECRRAACIHRALALDALLEHTGTPAGARAIAPLLSPRWQRALDLLSAPEREDKRTASGSLSFVVAPHGAHIFFHMEGKRGPSRSGKELHGNLASFIPRLRGHDRKIAETWALAGPGHRDDRNPFYGDALLLLAGHPAVRLDPRGPCVPVEVERASARVVETGGGVAISVIAAGQELEADASGFPSSSGYVLVRPAQDRVRLVVVPRELQRLLSAIHLHGATFPREALPGLVSVLPRIEAAAEVELPDDLRGEEVRAGSRPVLRISPSGTGLLLQVRVEPLPGGPLFVPGHGAPLSAAFDGARRRFARRDFERELAEATAVVAELGLDPAGASEPYAFAIDAGEAGVETLRRVHHLAARQAGPGVEWTGPRPRFTTPARLDRLRLRIEKKRDWFGLEGEVQVDGRRVALAALLEAARSRRRWVQLAPGDYAELSEELIARLSPLSHVAGDEETPTLTLGTVPLVEALAPEVEEIDAIAGWRKLTERLAQARERPCPLPEGLHGELRDYQIEGFRWLSRLAAFGAGACLADDMGLGKTLQALALLLSRASLGPALVVAPTSVLHAWRVEAARFAPGLRLRFFHEGDRDLSAPGPGDVVVVSWTSFARQGELFAGRTFATAVLDEAHAVKNSGTQRARAAHALQAEFVVALTGTPVENHAGELWSLFRATLPSLLGSEESFRRRFASGAPDAMKALAALVQPFILRRTKAQVAHELPPRTETDLLVPLSPEERALYDDVRLSAAADLGDLTGEKARFQVLAALTRLRLTACHPRLQDPGWRGPASKLARLLELVRDLSAAGHRALVFSQFTQHLALVADALRGDGIAFSYLDGQVPVPERARRVEAFQSGAGGDLFLISLKAGGTGLTLTAADYVIHLDPWWNPAVEDQASDRTHRIGQTRPVTVYRLVAEGTIEQQILSLHQEKRELVDELLAGADRAGKLSAEELAGLIRGTG
ncbi:MAG TPA: DEAD/DEAH box helicase [Myxococcales bacterium]|nr:DEAD/DEAH box helicase [Myxococcales bacterium]